MHSLNLIRKVQGECLDLGVQSYVNREIVAKCFGCRPEWEVEVKLGNCDGDDEEYCVAYGESIQFLWAEYERIDWHAVDK